jgi:hypothetical protein
MYKEKSMKRMVMFLLVLAAGIGLFAQELNFDGYFNSGLGVVTTDRKDSNNEKIDPYLTAFGVDAGQAAYRFRLNGAYTNEAGNAGVKFRFQSQTAELGETGLSFSIPYAYGWVKLLDGIFTINGGLVDNGTWGTGGTLLGRNGDDQGEGLGALVQISPIAGLDLGAGAYLVGIKGGSSNNVLARPLNSRLDFGDAKYTFNAAYTLENLLKVTGSFRVENETNGVIDPAAASPGAPESSRAIAGVKVLAVKDLTAVLEGEFNNLQDFSETGTTGIYETLGYKVGDLKFGLNTAQYITNVKDKDISLEFAPWVDYTLGAIVPRLDLVFFLGGAPDVNSNGYYHRLGYKPNYDSKTDVLSVRPSVKFNLGGDGKTFIEVGDVIYLANVTTDSTSVFTNAAYVDFKWSF